jgi:multidrug efflux pump subunit AcrA (membrane-fusion protein)
VFRSRAIAKEPNVDLDRPFRLVTAPAKFWLAIAITAALCGLLWLFGGKLAVQADGAGIIVNPPGNVQVFTPVSGTVEESLVMPGTTVAQGDAVATVTTANGENFVIAAPIDGTVVSLSTASYALIAEGGTVATIAPTAERMVSLLFVPAAVMNDVEAGQQVNVSPTTVDVTKAGYLVGTVSRIGLLPVTAERLQLVLGNTGLAQQLLAGGPVQEMLVLFEPDASAPLGLKWSGNGPAADKVIVSGTIVEAKIVLRNQTPWQAFTGN